MADILLNLNCSEHAIYSKILSGCAYIIKYGLNSPELFLRRVHQRQARRLRKKGVNINEPGKEYAVAENILHNLKVLPSPLIPTNLYTKLRQLLDIYGDETRSNYLSEIFHETKPATLYALQALLKTMHLLGTFERSWNCPCGKSIGGNGLSATMVALPITSYIMREKCSTPGHWFVSWGQQASDVEVVKLLIKHWQDLHPNSIIKPPYLSAIQTWYCHFGHETHVGIEPKEIPILEVEHIISPISFKKTLTGDFDISLYSSANKVEPDPRHLDNSNDHQKIRKCHPENVFNSIASLDSLDQLYVDNMENLQTLKYRLDSITSSDYGDHRDYMSDLEMSVASEDHQAARLLDLINFPQTVGEDKTFDRYDLDMSQFLQDICAPRNTSAPYVPSTPRRMQDMDTLARTILSGCGTGSYDIWGDYNLPSEPVVSSTENMSYWTPEPAATHAEPEDRLWRNLSQSEKRAKRQKLLAKLKVALRKTLVQKQVMVQAKKDAQVPQTSYNDQKDALLEENNQNVGYKHSPSQSRILGMMSKNQPSITDISELQKLANKIYPGKNKTQSDASEFNASPFRKPPHLIKEFVPKTDQKVEAAALQTPCLAQVELKPISILPPAERFLEHELAPPPYFEYDMMEYQTVPYFSTGQYQAQPGQYQAQAPIGVFKSQSLTPIAVSAIPVPPIPLELACTTPPNLTTVMMLSQLFANNNN